jgi:CheY-like chemotaxis protein
MTSKRILLVEDDLAIRQLLSVILQNENYITVKASNGNEGLHALEANKNHIDLILSDILMPDMDGFEFIKAVKGNPDFKTIPFIFLSAKTDAQSRIMGLRLGADDYIPKPFNRDEVSLKIKLLLEKSTSLKKSTITGLAGNLKNMSMKELLQVINITKRTGVIVIVSPAVSGALYFRGGILINAAIGDKWGEESAIKLVCLPEGDFRFEPNPLENIPALVTHTSEELLKYCNYEQSMPQHIENDHGLIVVKSSNGDLSGEEKSVLQLISLNPNITIAEIEKLLGQNSENTVSILLNKGYLAESNVEKPKAKVSIPSPDVISLDTVVNKLKQYENEHDLYAIHIGLLGSKQSVEKFTINLVKGASAAVEKIKFDPNTALGNIPNFILLKITLQTQVVYLHILACKSDQQFLWDAIFNPTIGTIILYEDEIKQEVEHFLQFTQQRNHKHVMHHPKEGTLEFLEILTLLDRIL